MPTGFFMFGYYSQPNSKPLFGWVLAAKDDNSDPSRVVLKMPLDYTLVWSSESIKTKDGNAKGYIWLPIPPQGYRAMGHVVTNSSEKLSIDKIRCVRSDLTEACERDALIWGANKDTNTFGINIYGMRPAIRGTHIPLSCLKNINSNFSLMPNTKQIEALIQTHLH
ncbi:hypothetical protein GIB67_019720 [Kingdonia uniflora]|uniref:Uncharacterized protein n=1 Tax=Kingdonia uniflora TaxID=39325 RepID=A0A7J7MK73_9MAGN|nr:hypothetical protein GIB67_019720 [Kingdonia uniflora]